MFEKALSGSERALFRYENMRGPAMGSERPLYSLRVPFIGSERALCMVLEGPLYGLRGPSMGSERALYRV